MLLAEDSSRSRPSAGSTNASFTMRWQSSNVPAHRQRAHVAAPAGELLLLPRRDQALGIEHHDVDPGPLVERRGHGAARVARGRDQDRQPARIVARNALERRREEARAEILERRRRAMEQLEHRQRPGGALHVDERRREIEGVARRSPAAAPRSHRPRRTAAAGPRPRPASCCAPSNAPAVDARQARSARRARRPARGPRDRLARGRRGAPASRVLWNCIGQSPTTRAPARSIAETQLSVSRP